MGKKSKQNQISQNGDNDESVVEGSEVIVSYEERVQNVSTIAKPLAGKKLTKRIFKLIKKAHKDKTNFFDGLKNVQLKLRKGEKGMVIFAGDVHPYDIMIHLPGVCEDADIPYCYVPSRQDLGTAMGVSRSLITVMIKEKSDYSDLYSEIEAEIRTLPVPI